ncbi:hypothetical protein EBB59_05915 [Lysobacter pythonis]|uniref:Protein sip-5 n=1 Tax=Solilutibacter pythonis TaxID=2483112 RepID=A0A3M2HUM0_9GAMM|nr:hypothetical protein [Lysobacter pythonis]RMH93411.1 hypothetical protein EBB59_05915 [Lysobacter pythonis]
MGFKQLIHKVTQAEQALEARERSVGADWRQLRTSWRAIWTPGRIVIAGLASGFLVGRTRPLAGIGGSGVLQMLSALSGLVAGGGAQAAVDEAENARHEAGTPREPNPPTRAAAPDAGGNDHESLRHYERLRRAGLT